MLQFIEGRAGSGKTEYARKLAAELAAQGRTVFMIVPKQYSFETERALLFSLGAGKAAEIEVLSFSRMLDRILHEFGGSSAKRLDDCGRSIYMSMALENVRKELTLYGKQYRNAEFIALMLKTMTECKMCGILPRQLRQTAESMEEGILRRKAEDVATICAEYDRLISAGFVDPEDDMTVLCEQLRQKPLFAGAAVIFDSFNRVTAQELAVLEQIFRQAGDCWFTVCRDPSIEDDTAGLFADTEDMERRILRCAKRNGIPVGKKLAVESGKRFLNEELKRVEDSVFRSKREVWTDATKWVSLIEAESRYEEADWVARKIHRLIREEGFRYNDFVVLLRSENDFAGILDDTFEKFGLPYFMDLPGGVEASAVMVTAEAALQAVLCGKKEASGAELDTEALLRCLKAGLCGFSVEQIAVLENYVFVWDIDRAEWLEKWEGHPDGFSAKPTEQSAARLEKLNALRENIVGRFTKLATGLRKPSGQEKAEALYAFLTAPEAEGMGTIQARMLRMSAELEMRAFEKEFAALRAEAENENAGDAVRLAQVWQEMGGTEHPFAEQQELFWQKMEVNMPQFAARHRRAWEQSRRRCAQPAEEQKRHWDLLMSILNQAGMILRGREVDGKAFLQLLQVAIKAASLSYIPKSLDCITVGSADRIRPASPRAVFVIGANQGVFPKAPAAEGVFNDGERRQLIEMGVELTETMDRQTLNERFSAYTALSSASERLFVSYAICDPSGGALLPSEIVSELKRSFSQLTVLSASRVPAEPEFPEEAFETLAARFDSTDALRQLLEVDFSAREEYGRTIEALQRTEQAPIHFEAPAAARRFFGDTLNLSASQVETYYQCPFRYFCRYGMRTSEKRKAKIDALEYGTMIHYVLENMLLRFPEKEQLLALDDERLCAEVQTLLETYLETNFGGRAGKSKRFLQIYDRYSAVAQELMQAMIDDFRQNRFEPADAELLIGQSDRDGEEGGRRIPSLELPLPGEGRIRVFGKVDRVDRMRSGDRSYIRILDYKTGAKEFSLTDVLFGLDMQMVIYLLTITERGKGRYGEVIPAGVLYVPAKTPHILAEHGEDAEALRKKRRKELRMSGIVRNEEQVIRGMEPEAEGKFIPVKYKKDNTPDPRSQVIAPEEMEILFRYVSGRLCEMGERLQKGEIPKKPVRRVCKFCEYAGVCGHEDEDEAFCLPSLKNSTVLEAMRGPEEKEKPELPEA